MQMIGAVAESSQSHFRAEAGDEVDLVLGRRFPAGQI
jgi:hypothetical protein